jgi:nucleotide-binding universal stress UspA family protein
VATRTLVGTDPAAALGELAQDDHDGALALATGGPNPVKEFILGSTFGRLLRNSPLPILAVSRPPGR